MVISRWRTGQFVQGRSCRLNEMVLFTLHYSINWIYTETDRGIVHLMHKRVDQKIHLNSHTNHSKWSKQTKSKSRWAQRHKTSIFYPFLHSCDKKGIMVIKCRLYTTKHIPLFPSKHHENLTNALKKFVYVQEWSLCFLKLFAGKTCSGLVFCLDLPSLGQGLVSNFKCLRLDKIPA
jgi:hypothetical protein